MKQMAGLETGLGPRRGAHIELEQSDLAKIPSSLVESLDFFDGIYRSLCAALYNYVPGSGHPGGSISSGRFVQSLLFDTMDYNFNLPDAPDADMISYAAGHKALGLYALWALRNEIIRAATPDLLPEEKYQLRLEDLLGFRRNPNSTAPLFKKFGTRALDGHPTPATPFIKLSTGASGVGVASSFGLALGALDIYRDDPPRVHIVEGEGGMTPGRVAEAFAAAGTMGLRNIVLHLDWNQASIDSNRVCRDGEQPGDYVQWDPVEFARLHDWNTIYVSDGFDYRQILAAQRKALAIQNSQPTAIIYRTVKGWQYGIEGRSSHGAGHKLCAAGFFTAIAPLLTQREVAIPRCEENAQRCRGCDQTIIEECFWEALRAVRAIFAEHREPVRQLADKIVESAARVRNRARAPRATAPRVAEVYRVVASSDVPAACRLKIGESTTLRGALGDALRYLNKISGGAVLVASADLAGSTSVSNIVKDFPEGFMHAAQNPDSRLLSVGGICEDAASGLLAGLSTHGWHIGVGSSYAAFIAPLGHIAARLHAIGCQARRALAPGDPNKPMILVCAHAGLKTGEDGPTHADPQALQIFQENFPGGLSIALTPWDPQEVWPTLAAALRARPAVIAPFVTRPNEVVLDRAALGLAPASEAANGVYELVAPDKSRPVDATVVLQESGVTMAFVMTALPLIRKAGLNLRAYYVASAELFDLLPEAEQARRFPESAAREAIGITGFTKSTLYRWVTSSAGREASLHPFQHGHFLGSGAGAAVISEAGLDGVAQFEAIRRYAEARRKI